MYAVKVRKVAFTNAAKRNLTAETDSFQQIKF